MRYRLVLLALCISTLGLTAHVAHALPPVHFWSHGFGNTGPDSGNSIAVDLSGNVFAVGYFNGTINLGGSDLVSAGGFDIFLVKYNSTGVHQWSKRLGGTSGDYGYGVATDWNGNVFITGAFQGTVDFGGGNLISAGNFDIFLAKYDSAGAHQWSQRFGSTGVDRGNAVAVEQLFGDVWVTGYFNGTVNFGGSNLTSAGGNDIFIAKYYSSGTHVHSRQAGGTGNDAGNAITVAPDQSVTVTGQFGGTANFGGVNLTSAGGDDIFLVRYSSGLSHQWSQRFGSTSQDTGNSVAATTSGDIFLVGGFNLTVNFGGADLTSAGLTDIIIAKYTSAGSHAWSHQYGGSSVDNALGIAADAAGNASVAGYSNGTIDLGGGDLSGAGYDILVARYSPAGEHRWSGRFSSSGLDYGNAVAVDPSGRVLLTGSVNGTVDFGGGSVGGAGSGDGFIAKFGVEASLPLIDSITDIGNDQGRHVNIRFTRTGYDDLESPSMVTSYEAYRRDDAPPATMSVIPDPAGLSPHAMLANGWTFAGSIPSHAETTYGMDVPTLGDSTIALGQYHSVFYIRASTAVPAIYFDSAADSGYSVDNLAPGAPQNFVYTAGALSWKESSAADFDFFTVYGSNTNSFGAATVVDYSVAPGMNVVASPYVYYFVTATDFSGNEGKPAKVNTLSGVGGTPKNYVLSVSNYPNPFNPRTTVGYTVPSRAAVTVVVYDAHGARVATLVDRVMRDAGAYTVGWDGRADSGATVSSGVYFARIEQSGATRSKKMVLLK